MKAFTVICALVAIALAMTLGINMHTEADHDSEQDQALQAAELRVQYVQQELQKAQNEVRIRQAELDIARGLLAEAKTSESGLKLQQTENGLKIRQLTEQLAQSKQAYETLDKQHREVKNELVQLHTASNPSEITRNRLNQYELEIADLQRQLRALQQAK